ncbi:MAG: hypothetical protein KF826_09460 [Xanthobacteraceae bacterium]|nr:hypothetical protein [Xanthobacteraceae bacterium]
MFDDKNLERIEALEEEVKEQKQELERTLSMFNSLLKRCNQLSEQNAQLKMMTTENRKYCERQFASVDRVLEKHGNRIYPTYYAVFPKQAEFDMELGRVFDKHKNLHQKS